MSPVNIHWKDSTEHRLNTLATDARRALTHLEERPWYRKGERQGGEGDDREWRWLDSSITDSTDTKFEQAPRVGDGQDSPACLQSIRVAESDMTEWLNMNRRRSLPVSNYKDNHLCLVSEALNFFELYFKFVTHFEFFVYMRCNWRFHFISCECPVVPAPLAFPLNCFILTLSKIELFSVDCFPGTLYMFVFVLITVVL